MRKITKEQMRSDKYRWFSMKSHNKTKNENKNSRSFCSGRIINTQIHTNYRSVSEQTINGNGNGECIMYRMLLLYTVHIVHIFEIGFIFQLLCDAQIRLETLNASCDYWL